VFLDWICYPEFTMQKQMRVILYGNTIVLVGIHLSLAANPSLEVQVVDTTQVSGQDLLALQPDVIIFDTHSILPEFHFNLIQQRPELQLIGIDPDTAQAQVWSGRQVVAAEAADLIRIIQQKER